MCAKISGSIWYKTTPTEAAKSIMIMLFMLFVIENFVDDEN